MPAISARWLSRERQQALRDRAEQRRRARGEPHRLLYFHQTDDPYSALVAQCLPTLLERYQVQLLPHIVGAPADDAAPERARLVAYSRRDAQLLAQRWGLAFVDPGAQPSADAVQRTQRQLVAAVDAGGFVEHAAALSQRLWALAPHTSPQAQPAPQLCDALPSADSATTQSHLAAAQALRARLGHYLGATFYYAGEWYWGIDRLHHLEARLQQLGAQRSVSRRAAPKANSTAVRSTEGFLMHRWAAPKANSTAVRSPQGSPISHFMFPPDPDLQHPTPLADAPVIDFFVSLRSPYSAIVTPRVFALARLTGARVRLRYLLPMAMRGLPVPRSKRRYISLDAAREARLRAIPFGRLNDPLGMPTERGLALMPLAERCGRAEPYLCSFMQGVWSEGIDAGSTRGLRRIAERAGLDWSDAQAALQDTAWRQIAEANRAAMFALGLWGVPSFQVRDQAFWGQDRLWAVQQVLLQGK